MGMGGPPPIPWSSLDPCAAARIWNQIYPNTTNPYEPRCEASLDAEQDEVSGNFRSGPDDSDRQEGDIQYIDGEPYTWLDGEWCPFHTGGVDPEIEDTPDDPPNGGIDMGMIIMMMLLFGGGGFAAGGTEGGIMGALLPLLLFGGGNLLGGLFGNDTDS